MTTERRITQDPFSFGSGFGKTSIGFEPLVKKLLESGPGLGNIPNYPPYNVRKINDDHYVIEMAVAGFGKQNLDIELKGDTLSVTGALEADTGEFIHKGIANRAFNRRFTIADGVEVKSSELINGMLKIYLERFIPENKKAKKIDIFDPFGIGDATKQLLTELRGVSQSDEEKKPTSSNNS
jgi:molecular chaperone IbpA